MFLCAYYISVAYIDACVSGFIEVVASLQPALAAHFSKMGAVFTYFFSSLQALFGLPYHRVDLIAGYDPSIFSCILYFQLIWRIVSVSPLTL